MFFILGILRVISFQGAVLKSQGELAYGCTEDLFWSQFSAGPDPFCCPEGFLPPACGTHRHWGFLKEWPGEETGRFKRHQMLWGICIFIEFHLDFFFKTSTILHVYLSSTGYSREFTKIPKQVPELLAQANLSFFTHVRELWFSMASPGDLSVYVHKQQTPRRRPMAASATLGTLTKQEAGGAPSVQLGRRTPLLPVLLI